MITVKHSPFNKPPLKVKDILPGRAYLVVSDPAHDTIGRVVIGCVRGINTHPAVHDLVGIDNAGGHWYSNETEYMLQEVDLEVHVKGWA